MLRLPIFPSMLRPAWQAMGMDTLASYTSVLLALCACSMINITDTLVANVQHVWLPFGAMLRHLLVHGTL